MKKMVICEIILVHPYFWLVSKAFFVLINIRFYVSLYEIGIVRGMKLSVVEDKVYKTVLKKIKQHLC